MIVSTPSPSTAEHAIMRIFLDFEASSLGKKSYPIEVGWVDENGEGQACLIRPASSWHDWDPAAEAVHGISRDHLLSDGESHEVVCARLIALWPGNTVYASAPSWDGHWLSMLLRAAGHPRHLVRLRDTQEVFDEALASRGLGGTDAEEAIKAARLAAEAGGLAHRALADARREWQIWKSLAGP
jgi:hypothetical protein